MGNSFPKVREWLQNLGIGEHAAVTQDEDEQDDEALPSRNDDSARNRCFLVTCDLFRCRRRMK